MSGCIHQIDNGEYVNKMESPPVGDTFEEYHGPEGDVQKGDIVVFDDPDTGMHAGQCPLVISHELVGYVTKVYAFDPDYRDGIEPEVGVTAPLGRLSISDNYVHVIPTTGNPEVRGAPVESATDAPEWVLDLATSLKCHDEYSEYMEIKRHGGWAAIGEEEAVEIGACNECQENEYGPTYINGK